MQALTVAIGPAGINYFSKQLVAGELTNALTKLKPPDRQIPVNDFGIGPPTQLFSRISINLSNGSLSNISPTFQSVTQQAGGQFQAVIAASNFNENYAWHETYHEEDEYSGPDGPYWKDYDVVHDYNYSAGIGELTTTVVLGFSYDQAAGSYDIDVVSVSGSPTNISPNVPGGSIINYTAAGWTFHVSQALLDALSVADFSKPLGTIFPPLLHSIPASGQLTPDIRYEFGLGDKGLTFPNDQGIAIGVTGRVTYQDQYYPGTPPAPLPLPPVPAATDTHHLQVYVSDYELNALHWAFYQAGLLDVTAVPGDFPNDPDILAVATYASWIPAFQDYIDYSMHVQVKPNQPPVVTFQDVYQFTDDAISLLKSQLPSDLYGWIAGAAIGTTHRAYVSFDDVKADVTALCARHKYTPTGQDWTYIETATHAMGMVATQDLEFTLTIDDSADNPNIVFDVQRTDILENLGLGESGTAQTLKYSFTHAYGKNAAGAIAVLVVVTFRSTTVPGFTSGDLFGTMIWPGVGEPKYDEAVSYMGQQGVPLPIMAGFQFLFEQAVLSIQKGYVSVLAQVAYKKELPSVKESSHGRERRTVRR